MLDIIHTFASGLFTIVGTLGLAHLIVEQRRRELLRTLYPPRNRNGGRGVRLPEASPRPTLASWLADHRR